MEGFCRASSPLSIADSMARFNEKWPKNRGFLKSRDAGARVSYDLSTTAPQGWQVISSRERLDRFSVTLSWCPTASL